MARIQKRVSDKPLTKEDVVETLNRELVPIIRALLLSFNALFKEGEGSPEGLVLANIGAQYVDVNGVPGSIVYLKTTNNVATGWLAVL